MGYLIDEILEKLKNNQDSSKVYGELEWYRQRCVLERPKFNEGDTNTVSGDAGKDILDEFLKKEEKYFFFENGELRKLEDIAKIDTAALQKDFYSFLSNNIGEPDEDQWGKNVTRAKAFVERLDLYRYQGNKDENQRKELIDRAKYTEDRLRFIYELIQNADDCEYKKNVEPKMSIEIDNDSIKVSYPEKGMTYSDILAITTIGQSNKVRKKIKKKIIGEKGRGFKTIYSVCKEADIYSGNYRFKLANFSPEWIDDDIDRLDGTTMVLPLNGTDNNGIFDKIIEKYGVHNDTITSQNILSSCPILFTNQIVDLTIKHAETNRKLHMWRKTNSDNSDEIEIGYEFINGDNVEPIVKTLSCIKIEQKTEFTFDEYDSRYKALFSREDYELLAGKEADIVKSYSSFIVIPDLSKLETVDPINNGKLYSYLPTDIDLISPFAIQIPFELNKDRSCMFTKDMESNGNEHSEEDYEGNTTKWNARLFRDVFEWREDHPSLLQKAYERIKDWPGKNDDIDQQVRVLNYIPDYKRKDDDFFWSGNDLNYANKINKYCKVDGSDSDIIFDCYKKMPLFKSIINNEKWLSIKDNSPIVFDKFVSDLICEALESGKKDALYDLMRAAFCKDSANSESNETDWLNRICVFVENVDRTKALGLKTAEDAFINRNNYNPDFTNALLNINYESVLNELFKTDGGRSKYLPKRDKTGIESLNIAFVKNNDRLERWCLKDRIWIVSNDDNYDNLKKYENNDDIAIFVRENNKLLWDAHEDFLKGNFTIIIGEYTILEICKKWKETKTGFKSFINLMELFLLIYGGDKDKGWYDFLCCKIDSDTDSCDLIQNIKTLWKSNFREEAESLGLVEQAEIIGIKLHNKNKLSQCYNLLPFNKWTDGIREALNKVSVDSERAYFKMDNTSPLSPVNNECLKEPFKTLFETTKGFPKEIMIFKASFGESSEQEFVRFADKNYLYVIFNNDKETDSEIPEETAKKCFDSIVDGLSVFIAKKQKLEKLLVNTKPIDSFDDAKKDLQDLKDLCALEANFLSSSRPESNDHYFWNELLQNANDHIPDKGEIKVSIKEKELELEYPDNGFSVRDFVAVCSSGNSGNLASTENREGKKGTGFKSVYDLFKKVTIQSKDIQCELADVERTITVNPKEENVTVSGLEDDLSKNAPEKYYPIPEFSQCEKIDGTKITFVLRGDKSPDELYQKIFGEKYCNVKENKNSNELKQLFIDKKAFLFLNCVSGFSFNIDGLKFDFPREEYIKENYYDYCQPFRDPENTIKPDSNRQWKRRFYEANENEQKKKELEKTFKDKKVVQVLFPKNVPSDSIDEDEKKVYCTLPIRGFKLMTPFYMNIPLLELEDSRNGLKINDNNFQKWNQEVIKAAFDGVAEIFKEASKTDEKFSDHLSLPILYKYFPYHYLSMSNHIQDPYVSVCDLLKKVPFLRVTNGEEVRACSYNDFNSQTGFLPDYMYWWFGKKKGLDGFSCSYQDTTDADTRKRFIYYDDVSVENEDGQEIVKGSHEIIKKQLLKMLYFGKLDAKESIKKYILKKAEESNHPGISDLSDDYIKFLSKIANDKNDKDQETAIKAFLIYCLGEEGLRKKYHCIGVDFSSANNNPETKIDGYKNINSIVERLKSCLELQLSQNDSSFIKSAFTHLLESPYLVYKRVPWSSDDTEGQLRPFSELENQNLFKVLFEENIDILINHANDITEKVLKDYQVSIKQWIISGISCFKDRFVSFLLEVLRKNWQHCWGKIRSFINEILDTDKSEMHKDLSELFKYLIEIDKITCTYPYPQQTHWVECYSNYIKYCEQGDLYKSCFVFDDTNLEQLSKEEKAHFNDKVSEEAKNKTLDNNSFPSGLKNKELRIIIESSIYRKDCPSGGGNLYCFAKYKSYDVIVLFSDGAFGKMLRDVFDCREYSEALPYKKMVCRPGDELMGWENYEDIGDDEIEEIIASLDLSNDLLIDHLVAPFTRQTKSRLIEARGYGGDKYEEKKCPVCGSVLLAERSSLTLGNVSADINSKRIYLPLLMCRNCKEALRYSNDFSWIKNNENDLKEELQLSTVCNDELPKFRLTFDSVYETKDVQVPLTYLLRLVWYKKITTTLGCDRGPSQDTLGDTVPDTVPDTVKNL